MGKTITVNRDRLVNLLQTFYNQGFNDASHTTEILDVTEDANFQLHLLIVDQQLEDDQLEYERIRQQELEQSAKELLEWEKKERLFYDTLPDDLV
jgi:hypothetical protein